MTSKIKHNVSKINKAVLSTQFKIPEEISKLAWPEAQIIVEPIFWRYIEKNELMRFCVIFEHKYKQQEKYFLRQVISYHLLIGTLELTKTGYQPSGPIRHEFSGKNNSEIFKKLIATYDVWN